MHYDMSLAEESGIGITVREKMWYHREEVCGQKM